MRSSKLSKILINYYNEGNQSLDSVGGHFVDIGHESIELRDMHIDGAIVWTNNSIQFNGNVIQQIEDSPDIFISDIKKIIFTHCTFDMYPAIMNDAIWSITFDYCEFKSSENLAKGLLRDTEDLSKRIHFNSCNFEYFSIGDKEDIQRNKSEQLCRFDLCGGEIKNLTIQNIELIKKLYINRQQDDTCSLKTEIKNLKIYDSIFKDNFKLHNCNIQNILIKNTDFEKQADFYKSSFHNGINEYNDKTIYFKALNFEGLTIFGHCDFTKKVVFSEVTFENFVHFKEANFDNGLDLDYTNIQKEMNFFAVTGLDSRESQDKTSQETYRIIKHNFQKIGNQIESNKYHALELNSHRQDIWNKIKEETWHKILNLSFPYNELYFDFKDFKKIGILTFDILPSLVHRASSNYGQSWFLPLTWILVVGWITNCLIIECNLDNIFNLKEILKHISIINLDEKLKESPAIFLFNKISLGYLYYQFIIATRKNTKK